MGPHILGGREIVFYREDKNANRPTISGKKEREGGCRGRPFISQLARKGRKKVWSIKPDRTTC